MLISIYLLTGLILLYFGGEWLVDNAVKLAKYIGISPMAIGLTVVAFGTSAPELLVSLNSALMGYDDISVANVVGSNITNILLIMGISVLFFPMSSDKIAIKNQGSMLFFSCLLMILSCMDGIINRFEGALLFTFLITYVIYTIIQSKKILKKQKFQITSSEPVSYIEPEVKKSVKDGITFQILMLVSGMVALSFGAELFVTGAVELATIIGVSEAVIGLTVVAIGTSLPELVAGTIAAIRKSPDVAIGSIIGSNIFNILSILGITALVKPIKVSAEIFDFSIWFMCAVTAIFLVVMYFTPKASKREGSAFLMLFLTYNLIIIWPYLN